MKIASTRTIKQADGTIKVIFRGYKHELDKIIPAYKSMEFDTGDKCPECGNGRIALLSCFVDRANKDSEPYYEGVEEGNEEEVRLNDNISVCIHACDECGHIVRRWFSDFYPGD